MASFTALKTAIQNAIKQNGNEEITGDVLQQILLSIVNTMGDGAINTIEQNLSSETLARQGADNTLQSNINAEALARGNADTQLQNAINAIKANIDNGYVYAGIATPKATPVSGKVFYIATAAGTYTNFGGQVLTQGINILRYNGSEWSNQQLIGIDDVPTAGSNNLLKSGGVQNELALGAVYDVSAKNPTGGPNNDGKWESLSALLSDANLNTLIPTAYRKGGMSIKFVHTSDNKYVQARFMLSGSFTDAQFTNVANWQGVDVTPIAGSKNIVESDGVNSNIKSLSKITLDDFAQYGYYKSSDGSYVGNTSAAKLTGYIKVNKGDFIRYNIFLLPAQLEIVAFDSNFNIILSSSIAGRANTNENIYVVPSGVSYIRMSEGGGPTHVGNASISNSINELSRVNSFITRFPFIHDRVLLLYANANFTLSNLVIKRVYNMPDGFRFFFDVYEPTHTSTALNVRIIESQSIAKTGFYEAINTIGPSTIKIGMYFYGEVSELDSVNIQIPTTSVLQSDIEPINDIFEVKNEIGEILGNEVPLSINWKEGRLDYNNGSYTGWTNSGTYWNSGYIKLPKGKYSVTGKTDANRAPMVISFNNDYTFNSILIAGSSTISSYTFTLGEETIIACNTYHTTVSNFKLEKLNDGTLDICENFSEVNNKLYYRGQPIASESSISTVVTDLPVSDGTDIDSGYAYIDSTDRTIKVKA